MKLTEGCKSADYLSLISPTSVLFPFFIPKSIGFVSADSPSLSYLGNSIVFVFFKRFYTDCVFFIYCKPICSYRLKTFTSAIVSNLLNVFYFSCDLFSSLSLSSLLYCSSFSRIIGSNSFWVHITMLKVEIKIASDDMIMPTRSKV